MTNDSSPGHMRAIAPLFLLSILGILCTAGFQLVVIRQLGPEGFGMLAIYLALINVASIGSSAIRNSVAVGVARMELQRVGRADRTLQESVVYGSLFVAGVVFLLLTGAYPSWIAGILVAVSVIPYFVFARSQGLMQGSGHVTRVLVWSTVAQVAQLVFSLVALAIGAGWLGVLVATVLVAIIGAVLSQWDSTKLKLTSTVKPFSRVTINALLVSIAFTWLISMDVTWVNQFSTAEVAGKYGSAAVLIKVAFLVPTTLALYLLPRFAKNLDDIQFQVKGLLWSASAALVSGALFVLVLWVWPAGITLLFGPEYEEVAQIALWVAIAFLPWVISQSLVTQLTARGSTATIIVLALAAVVQFLLAKGVLPNLDSWILSQGVIGLGVLISLAAIVWANNRRTLTGVGTHN